MKQLYSVVYIVFVCTLTATAQTGKQFIYGKVQDAATGSAIERADVLEKNTGTGTSTDKNGAFSLLVEFPGRLSVSHIGYETQNIAITDFIGDTLFVLLKKVATELPVVSILPGKAENITKNKELSVMDYEFMDDKVLVLSQSTRFSKPSLILLNENFDTITVSPLEVHPDFIFRDCMDNLHLSAKDFAFQLNYNGIRIQLLYPISADELKTKLQPCIEKLHNKLYFSEYANKGLSLLYFFKDTAQEKNNLMKVISDRRKLNMMEGEVAFALAEGHSYEEWDKHFFDSLVVSKVYAPLVKLNDTIYVFNFAAGYIEQYSEEGKLIHSVPVSFHEQRNWKKNILTDETENKCYAMFEKNGVVQLKQVNITTGKIESTTDFSGFPFAENLKVRGGYVYFLYPDASRQGYMRLYRKRL